MVYVPKNDVAKLNNRHKYIIYYIILILYESALLLFYMNISTRAFSCFAKWCTEKNNFITSCVVTAVNQRMVGNIGVLLLPRCERCYWREERGLRDIIIKKMSHFNVCRVLRIYYYFIKYYYVGTII